VSELELTPESFAFQCTVPEKSGRLAWAFLLAAAYLKQLLELPETFQFNGHYGYSFKNAENNPLADSGNFSEDRSLLGGITLRGLKRKAANSISIAHHQVQFSYAVFDPKSRRLFGWSPDLLGDAAQAERLEAFTPYAKPGQVFLFDKAQLKQLRAQVRPAPGSE
jgi:hypothetical protein